jgi:hypothetical protein
MLVQPASAGFGYQTPVSTGGRNDDRRRGGIARARNAAFVVLIETGVPAYAVKHLFSLCQSDAAQCWCFALVPNSITNRSAIYAAVYSYTAAYTAYGSATKLTLGDLI